MSNWIKGCLGKDKGTDLDTCSRQWLEAVLDTANKDCLHLQCNSTLVEFFLVLKLKRLSFRGKLNKLVPTLTPARNGSDHSC